MAPSDGAARPSPEAIPICIGHYCRPRLRPEGSRPVGKTPAELESLGDVPPF
jgi:hypothetical protein